MNELFTPDAALITAFASAATTGLFLAALAGLTWLFGRID